jgi:hypothetical protein
MPSGKAQPCQEDLRPWTSVHCVFIVYVMFLRC